MKMKILWKGTGINEVGILDNREIIKIDKNYFRPTEVDTLLGDSSKAKKDLDWSPKYSFESLVEDMVSQDLNLSKKDVLIRNSNHKTK